MKKLLLMIFLVIPVMGYCGFIGWITGYPEVKAKIEKALEQKYHGDKFEVSDVSYSENLRAYNFKAKDITRDLISGGSYYETKDAVVDDFKWMLVSAQWKELSKPIIEKYSKNYIMFGGLGTDSPLKEKGDKTDYTGKALADLFGKHLTVKQWLKIDHDYIGAKTDLYVGMPNSAAGVLKALELIQDLNNYYRSLNLYTYELSITFMNVPKDLNIYDFVYNKSENDKKYRLNDFKNDGDIQKYAWGWIRIYGCAKSLNFKKICNNYKIYKNQMPTDKFDIELIKERSTADRINNLNDIAKEFHLYTNPGHITMWHENTVKIKGKMKTFRSYAWIPLRMAYQPLKDTKYYSQVKNILANQK
ncbi:hypothetical protein [Francisella sp. 19X1-34]|uniref:hypothetical protein n=1 Tax=Francisella sp. 19X1-34 TaxID=3087177 RepID=UPI002E349CBA|nr:hypothetical protein [Francisella sp. 19X1-34]MED7788159.1 hypothetical protein [Francisella sp. 19X1-34]